MKYNPPTFTEFVDKSLFFQAATKHMETISYGSDKEDNLYLWASELPNSKFQLKSVSRKDPVKNILLSSSSKSPDAIKRLFDQILFDTDRKFGGTAELTANTVSRMIKSFNTNHSGVFLSEKVKEWTSILFEQVIPRELAKAALPNTSDTFAETLQSLYELYDEELVAAVVKAVLLAGSGGNIIVQQSPYYGKFAVVNGSSGYQFKTFEQSKMFIGLKRFRADKAVSFTNPKLLLVNGAVEDFSEIEELLDEAAKTNQPLIVIAERIGDEIYDIFKLNFEKSIVDCFALETIKDYIAVNTVIDAGVVAGSAPITPFTAHSEFLLAKWDSLPTIDEIIISKDGKVTFKNAATEIAVKTHIKNIAAKRQEITFEEFSVKEPNFTSRIQNLTTSPTYLFVPYKTEAEGETKRIMVDTLLRYLKSVISYGVLLLSGNEKDEIILTLQSQIKDSEQEIFERHKWFFDTLLSNTHGYVPYLHIAGAKRLIANHLAQIFSINGMIINVE